MIPFPNDDTTPPVTKIYLVSTSDECYVVCRAGETLVRMSLQMICKDNALFNFVQTHAEKGSEFREILAIMAWLFEPVDLLADFGGNLLGRFLACF